jgi:branched-subunit amino acid ABC-type transport system permease component
VHLLSLSVGFGLVSAAILALAAVGFTLQFGVTNILNLAFGSTMTLSAFIAYLANQAGVNVWAAVPVGGVAGAVASVVIGRAVYAPFRRRGLSLFAMIMVALAMEVVIQHGIELTWGTGNYTYKMPFTRSFHVVGMVFSTDQLYVIALAVGAMLGVHVLLRYTAIGKALRAIACSPQRARECGIPVERMTDFAWALSGFLCGLAGVVLVINVQNLTSTSGTDFVILVIAAAVLGGVGSPYGAMIGALVIGVVGEVSAAYINPSLNEVSAFALLGLTLLVRPRGLVSRLATVKGVAA